MWGTLWGTRKDAKDSFWVGGGGQVTEEVTSERGFEEVLQLRTQEKKNH